MLEPVKFPTVKPKHNKFFQVITISREYGGRKPGRKSLPHLPKLCPKLGTMIPFLDVLHGPFLLESDLLMPSVNKHSENQNIKPDCQVLSGYEIKQVRFWGFFNNVHLISCFIINRNKS